MSSVNPDKSPTSDDSPDGPGRSQYESSDLLGTEGDNLPHPASPSPMEYKRRMEQSDPIGNADTSPAAEASASSSQGSPAGQSDADLVQQTRIQIRGLVQEIAQLAQSDCTTEDFFEGFLTRVTSALASLGGAIWMVDDQEQIQLQYQINLEKTGIAESEEGQVQHHLLLKKILQQPEPNLIPPSSGGVDSDEAGNPCESLLVVAPLLIDGQVAGIVEIFQRAGAGPTTQRGYLRFLAQMCDLASDFLKNRRIRQFQDQQKLWNRLENFIRSIHRSLDSKQTLFAIANEGRRLIECDRVAIATMKGRHCQVQVVSGLDSIDRRAAEVKELGRLATVVTRARQPLWYSGDDSELPPQIESVLHEYLDIAHAKLVTIHPLYPPRQESDEREGHRVESEEKPIGALIVEQLGDSSVTPTIRQRVEVVAGHSADALSNALEHNDVMLMPMWRTLGRVGWVVQARQLPKTVFALALVTAIVVGMFAVPYSFELGAKGSLVPTTRQEIFAPISGTVREMNIPKDPTAILDQGELLLVLENKDLEQQINELQGKAEQLSARQKSLKRAIAKSNTVGDRADTVRLQGDLAEAEVLEKAAWEQHAIRVEEHHQREVRIPIRGQVTNWQVEEKLDDRHVQRGQYLMTVIDPTKQWHLELEMPDDEMGHLFDAAKESAGPLDVVFVLVSHPDREFRGQIHEIGQRVDVSAEDLAVVKIQVTIESDLPADAIREGTRLKAKIACGKRSIGYVLFNDLYETVQSKVLFWF